MAVTVRRGAPGTGRGIFHLAFRGPYVRCDQAGKMTGEGDKNGRIFTGGEPRVGIFWLIVRARACNCWQALVPCRRLNPMASN